jgi:uncharacterized phage-associated protein
MDAQEKSDRLIETAIAALSASPSHRLNAVVLNKALFYIDLASLRDHGATLTGNTFVAIQWGPVIAKYAQRLIGPLESRGIARQTSEWDGSKPIVLEARPSEFHFISAESLLLVSDVVTFFADATSRRASEFSHQNPGWQLAWSEFRRTGRPCAIDMRVAMQQIIEDDPWMDVPLADDDEVLRAADAELGEDW